MNTKLNVLLVAGAALALNGCATLVLGGAAKVGSVVAEERTVGEAVDDTAIWTEIKSNYLQKNFDNIFNAVNVEVKQGRVLLTGQVVNPDHRIQAVRLAWQPQGVKEVINELQINDQSSLKNATNDIWINGQVKTKLLLERNVRSINYSVDTINGVVYLLGIAQNDWERRQAALVASRVKGVKKVVSHVQVKQNPSPAPIRPAKVDD